MRLKNQKKKPKDLAPNYTMDNNTNLKRKAEYELEGTISKVAKTSHVCETCGKVGVSKEIIEKVEKNSMWLYTG